MGVRNAMLGFVALGIFASYGCEPPGPKLKPTFPLIGEVYVDGSPAENLAVYCNDVSAADKTADTPSAAFTDANGKFSISTYKQADGIPEGEYVLTFMWGQLNVFNASYGGPDKLNERYTDPMRSEFKVKVEKGKPIDMGRIQLTTQ